MMSIHKSVTLTSAAVLLWSSTIYADKLPFERFAYQELTEQEEPSQVLNAIGRCLGTFALAVDPPLNANFDANNPDASAHKASDTFLTFAIATHWRWNSYSEQGKSDDEIKALLAELNQEVINSAAYYADAYAQWLGRSGVEDIASLPQHHPFMIELNQCLKVGVQGSGASN